MRLLQCFFSLQWASLLTTASIMMTEGLNASAELYPEDLAALHLTQLIGGMEVPIFNDSLYDSDKPDSPGDDSLRAPPLGAFPYMTLEVCKTAILNKNLAKHPLFWGRCFNDAKVATETAKQPGAKYPMLAGYTIISEMMPKGTVPKYTANFNNESKEIQDAAFNAFWSSCSQALATMSEGRVYVMLLNPTNVLRGGKLNWVKGGAREGSTIELHEYPQLCRNAKVTGMIHLSSRDNKFAEDLTAKLLDDRKRNKCPPIGSIPVRK